MRSPSHNSTFQTNYGNSGTTFRNSKTTIPSQSYTLDDQDKVEDLDTLQPHQTEVELGSEPDYEYDAAREASPTFHYRRRSLISISLAEFTDKRQAPLTIDAVAQKLGRGIGKDVASWKEYLNSYCNVSYSCLLEQSEASAIPIDLEYFIANCLGGV